jgi:lysozyme family protein
MDNSPIPVVTDFKSAFTALLGIEGGYSNNPDDSGGETMWGITEAVARASGYEGEMQAMPVEIAQMIYKSRYWVAHQCDQLPIGIAYQIFDAAVNGGDPIRWLQRALGIAEDGILGAGTIGTARTCSTIPVISRFCAYHLEYYVSLKKPEFLGGWANRIARNLLIGAIHAN